MNKICTDKTNNANILIRFLMKIKSVFKKNKFLLFISPWLIGFLLLTIIPMIASFVISFTEWNILTKPKFVGFDNYINIFNDPIFYKSLKVTFVFTAFNVPINVALSLLVAMLLNNKIKCINLYRTIYYLPAVVSGVVVSLLWKWIFNGEFGLLNNFLIKFGIQGPRWLMDEFWVMPAMVIMSIWGIGGGIIMYLSGLQGIPAYLYESARLDAAGWWTRLTKITIPSMSPVLFFTTLTNIIGSLQTFTSAYIMTEGGPNNQTMFYAFYIYKHAFTWKQMGKASALAWLLFFIIMALTIIFVKFSKGKIYYESKDGGDIL